MGFVSSGKHFRGRNFVLRSVEKSIQEVFHYCLKEYNGFIYDGYIYIQLPRALNLLFLLLTLCYSILFMAFLSLVKDARCHSENSGKNTRLASDYPLVLEVRIQYHSGLVLFLLGSLLGCYS